MTRGRSPPPGTTSEESRHHYARPAPDTNPTPTPRLPYLYHLLVAPPKPTRRRPYSFFEKAEFHLEQRHDPGHPRTPGGGGWGGRKHRPRESSVKSFRQDQLAGSFRGSLPSIELLILSSLEHMLLSPNATQLHSNFSPQRKRTLPRITESSGAASSSVNINLWHGGRHRSNHLCYRQVSAMPSAQGTRYRER